MSSTDDTDGNGGIQEVIDALARLSPADEQEIIDELKSQDYDKKIKYYDGRVGGLRDGLILIKLHQQIEAQKKLIQNLEVVNPSQSHEAESKGRATTQKALHNKHYMMRAEQLKILSDLYDNKFLIFEQGRVKDVVQEHRESHPLNTEACPICFEEIPITAVDSVLYFVCCGNFMCYQCGQATCAGGRIRMKNCPLCREDIFLEKEKLVRQAETQAKRGRPWAQNTITKKMVRQVETQAKRGRPWAQTQLGIYYLDGSSCEHGEAVHHTVDIKEALKWFKLAAEQKQPDAIRIIAQLHGGVYGDVKEVEQCQIKARALMKEAADLGNLRAQRNYAMMCRLGQGGSEDKSEAAHYYTLAYAQKGLKFEKDEVFPLEISDNWSEEILHAALYLGIYHYQSGGGLTHSLHIAKHYLEEHIKESEKQRRHVGADAYMYLAACLMVLQEFTLCRGFASFSLPRYNSVPRAMSLYRKAVKLGIEHPNGYSQRSKDILEGLVTSLKGNCANCGVASKDSPEWKLKGCGRCHCVWYCGKKCQMEHWKAGHKSDCVRQQV